jgi:hypothetical protein
LVKVCLRRTLHCILSQALFVQSRTSRALLSLYTPSAHLDFDRYGRSSTSLIMCPQRSAIYCSLRRQCHLGCFTPYRIRNCTCSCTRISCYGVVCCLEVYEDMMSCDVEYVANEQTADLLFICLTRTLLGNAVIPRLRRIRGGFAVF